MTTGQRKQTEASRSSTCGEPKANAYRTRSRSTLKIANGYKALEAVREEQTYACSQNGEANTNRSEQRYRLTQAPANQGETGHAEGKLRDATLTVKRSLPGYPHPGHKG